MPPPNRWDAYIPLGKIIQGTKFIAFKVPLKEALMTAVEDIQKFSPSILKERLNELGIKMGLIIDLTNTRKYYNETEFTDHDIEYKKIFTQGHMVPGDSEFQNFAEAVHRFNKKDQVIGVHCTHGVNRTGYMICRYMIEQLSFTPDDALKYFGEARGHEVERENYIFDLKRRRKGQVSVHLDKYNKPNDVLDANGMQFQREGHKMRWRHNRDAHPNWRRKPSFMENGALGGHSRRMWNSSTRGQNDSFNCYASSPQSFQSNDYRGMNVQSFGPSNVYRNHASVDQQGYPPYSYGRPFPSTFKSNLGKSDSCWREDQQNFPKYLG